MEKIILLMGILFLPIWQIDLPKPKSKFEYVLAYIIILYTNLMFSWGLWSLMGMMGWLNGNLQ